LGSAEYKLQQQHIWCRVNAEQHASPNAAWPETVLVMIEIDALTRAERLTQE
jgi:hypothetical protein